MKQINFGRSNQRGNTALYMFIMAALIIALFSLATTVLLKLNIGTSPAWRAYNAADQCLKEFDNRVSYQTFTCSPGQFVKMDNALSVGCSTDTDDADRDTGSGCTCVIEYGEYSAPNHIVTAIGRCPGDDSLEIPAGTTRSSASNYVEVTISANVSTGTAPCTPDCSGAFGCCDGCGGTCALLCSGTCDTGSCVCD